MVKEYSRCMAYLQDPGYSNASSQLVAATLGLSWMSLGQLSFYLKLTALQDTGIFN